MASSGDLIRATAATLGLPQRAVSYPFERLQDAGVVSKGKRGKGGARPNFTDAASLLIAVGGWLPLKDVVAIEREYAGLPSGYRDAHSDTKGKTSVWPGLCDLPRHHSFHDAISALLNASSNSSLSAALLENWKKEFPDSQARHLPLMEVIFLGPFPQATIKIGYGSNKFEEHNYSSMPSSIELIQEWEKTAPPDPGDLKQIRIVSEKTIFALGELLKS